MGVVLQNFPPNPAVGEEVALPLRYNDVSGATDLKTAKVNAFVVLGFGKLELEGKIQLGQDSRCEHWNNEPLLIPFWMTGVGGSWG